jgi:hypothetical protein
VEELVAVERLRDVGVESRGDTSGTQRARTVNASSAEPAARTSAPAEARTFRTASFESGSSSTIRTRMRSSAIVSRWS